MPIDDESNPRADEAFKRELLDNLPAITPYSRRLARNRHLAEDLVQDTLLRALEKHYQWERGTNLAAWLRTIMRNRFFEYHRKVQPIFVGSFSDESNTALPEEARQPLCMEVLETGRAIGRLQTDFRQVLEMVALDGVSYEDAAQTLNVPVGTIRSRLSRARSSLRNDLDSTRRYPLPHVAEAFHKEPEYSPHS